jgi:hypothetical protein
MFCSTCRVSPKRLRFHTPSSHLRVLILSVDRATSSNESLASAMRSGSCAPRHAAPTRDSAWGSAPGSHRAQPRGTRCCWSSSCRASPRTQPRRSCADSPASLRAGCCDPGPARTVGFAGQGYPSAHCITGQFDVGEGVGGLWCCGAAVLCVGGSVCPMGYQIANGF